MKLTRPPSYLPSLGAALLSAPAAAFTASVLWRLWLLRRSPPTAQVSPLTSPHLSVVPSPTTLGCLNIAYHHASVSSEFRTSPWVSRLIAAPPPNRVRYPTDRQFASGCSPRRFGPTQLPSATELWLSPARTFTVLIWRLHGRTHSRMLVAGIQVEFGLDPRLKHSGVTILGSRISSPQPQFFERAREVHEGQRIGEFTSCFSRHPSKVGSGPLSSRPIPRWPTATAS